MNIRTKLYSARETNNWRRAGPAQKFSGTLWAPDGRKIEDDLNIAPVNFGISIDLASAAYGKAAIAPLGATRAT
jgi:hypothetical protein